MIFDNISLAWHALVGGRKAVQLIPTWDVGRPRTIAVDYSTLSRDGYSRNELVFACIRYLARAAAEPAMRVLVGAKLDREAPESHPLVRLLDAPNSNMSMYDVIEATIVMLNIAGDAYWEKERARNGQVLALWPMRPDRVQIVPRADGVAGYIYSVDGINGLELPAEDVVHFSYYDPMSDYFGLSPLAICAKAADADNERTDYTRQFFQNAAMPYGLLKTKQNLTDAEAARLRRLWAENYAGTGNWHKLAVLGSDAEYQRLGLTQQEMAFPDLTKLSETRICMVFGVPPILIGSLVGLERSTYSNYQEARVAFWQDTMSPLLRKMEDTLNLSLAGDFGARIDIDTTEVKALQEDRTVVVTRVQAALAGGWMTVNEAREEAGLDPVDGGDVFLRPMTMNVVDANADAESQKPPEKPAPVIMPPAAVHELPAGEEAPVDETVPTETAPAKALLLPDLQTKAASRTDQIARAHELQFERAARRLFRAEQVQITGLLAGKGRQKADWLHIFWAGAEAIIAASVDNWRQAFMPLIAAVITEQAEAMAAVFGISWDVHNPHVQEFIRSYTFKFADKISSTTADSIRALMEQADADGWTVPELQRQLADLYDGWDDIRTEQIARSETIRSANQGSRFLYREAGVTKLRWLATGDDRTCPWCSDMDGKIIGIDDAFFSQGDTYTVGDQPLNLDYEDVTAPPLHVSCRCTIVSGD